MSDPTYPGAPDSLIETWNLRRRPLRGARGEGLPPPDADLKALLAARVPEAEEPPRPVSPQQVSLRPRDRIRLPVTGR